MKKVAILLDGGFILIKLGERLKQSPTPDQVCEFAEACVNSDEELFRIYYYDCLPFGKRKMNPVTHSWIDFAGTATYQRKMNFFKELSPKDHIAFRKGVLSLVGWALTNRATGELIRTRRQIVDTDFEPDFRQTRVDMKIGLDIAWLSAKGIVDRIILVTGDSDFVPAMKFARREGVQVVLVTLGHRLIKRELKDHADEVRDVQYPPGKP